MTDTSHPQGQPDKAPDIDPMDVEDWAEFKAWKQARQSGDLAEDNGLLPILPESLQITDPDNPDKVHEFKMAPLDTDTVATLQALATFAETQTDKAAAMFQAVLLPQEYERLAQMIPRLIRAQRKRRLADPEAASVEDMWVALAKAAAEPLMEAMNDPKQFASQLGRSENGAGLPSTSTASALPSGTSAPGSSGVTS